MKRVRLTGPVTPEDGGSAIKERYPRKTRGEVLQGTGPGLDLRRAARGRPLLIDE